jgi:hypothetical protein
VFAVLSVTVTSAAVPLVSWLPAVLTPGRLMLALPLNDTPPIVLAVASTVAVSALPVTSPVSVPTNPVAVTLPVLGLYVSVPSDSRPKLPPSTLPPAVKIRALFSSVDSLSVIVTVVASVASATSIFAEPSNDVPPIVLAVASTVAVSALPVNAPMCVVAVRFLIPV